MGTILIIVLIILLLGGGGGYYGYNRYGAPGVGGALVLGPDHSYRALARRRREFQPPLTRKTGGPARVLD
jgi:hypothetical protein